MINQILDRFHPMKILSNFSEIIFLKNYSTYNTFCVCMIIKLDFMHNIALLYVIYILNTQFVFVLFASYESLDYLFFARECNTQGKRKIIQFEVF